MKILLMEYDPWESVKGWNPDQVESWSEASPSYTTGEKK